MTSKKEGRAVVDDPTAVDVSRQLMPTIAISMHRRRTRSHLPVRRCADNELEPRGARRAAQLVQAESPRPTRQRTPLDLLLADENGSTFSARPIVGARPDPGDVSDPAREIGAGAAGQRQPEETDDPCWAPKREAVSFGARPEFNKPRWWSGRRSHGTSGRGFQVDAECGETASQADPSDDPSADHGSDSRVRSSPTMIFALDRSVLPSPQRCSTVTVPS